MPTTEYTVTGMTCGHCKQAVTDEVSAVPGVTGVEVDLPAGRLTVTGGDGLDPGAVIDAVEAAGYQAQAPETA